MTSTHQFFRSPRLRDDVDVEPTDTGFALVYRQQSADIDVPPDALQDMGRLLTALRTGAPVTELAAAVPALRDLDGFLDELDRLGLITEGGQTPPPPVGTVSGQSLYRAVRRLVRVQQASLGASLLYRAMIEGEATRTQLIGYAIEYHHVVRRSPALIAPAIAHAWEPDAFDILQRFFADELGHDEMTERALASVGVSRERLLHAEPLPSTFAVCSTLGATAAQDPLSFAACLLLVEEPQPEFNRAFREAARERDLPEEFVQPLLDHSGINEIGGHDDVARRLFATVDVVGLEHEQAVLKQVAAMVELLAQMDRDIVTHYVGPNIDLRVFEPPVPEER